MDTSIVSLLDSIRAFAFTASLWAFVALNATAVAVLLATRNRALVQRYTSAWLATNLLLLGTGVGVPLVAGVCKAVVEVTSLTVATQAPARVD